MPQNVTCRDCGEIQHSPAISDRNGQYYARYTCTTDQRAWEVKITEWTEVERACWYRDNVLSRLGLESAVHQLPWKTAA